MNRIAITTITYNSEKFISRCIESISTQSVKPDSYTIVDGKSTDNTLAIIKEAAAIGTVSKFITEKDRGISHGFNKSWHCADADYICNINSDDWLGTDYIKKVQQHIEQEDPDILIGQLGFVSDSKIRWIKPNIPNSYPPKRWLNFAINHPGMVIRKSLLKNIGGYSEDYDVAMDVDLFFNLLKSSPKIVIMEDALVFQSDHGVSQQKWMTALRELKDIEIKHHRPVFSANMVFLYRVFKIWVKKKLLFLF